MAPFHQCISQAWAGKEKALWPVSAWCWACNIHTNNAVHNWWNGTCYNNILQEARINGGWKKMRDVPYAVTLNWIWCQLSFALLRASIMSIRGARSSQHHSATGVSNRPLAWGRPSETNSQTAHMHIYIYLIYNHHTRVTIRYIQCIIASFTQILYLS